MEQEAGPTQTQTNCEGLSLCQSSSAPNLQSRPRSRVRPSPELRPVQRPVQSRNRSRGWGHSVRKDHDLLLQCQLVAQSCGHKDLVPVMVETPEPNDGHGCRGCLSLKSLACGIPEDGQADCGLGGCGGINYGLGAW